VSASDGKKFMWRRERKKTNRKIPEASTQRHIDARQLIVGLVAALLLAAVAWAGMRLADPRTMPLTTVHVDGEFHRVPAAQVRAVVAEHTQSGFLALDVDAVYADLLALPWVRSVSVRRVWPDALHVALTENSAFVRWGESALLNDYGEPFAPLQLSDALRQLPRIEGPDNSELQMVESYRKMTQLLAPLALKIVRLVQDARRSWRVELNNGITLMLGRLDSEQRVQRFVRFYPQVLARRAVRIERIDLRYSSGFSVRWSDSADQELLLNGIG